MSGREPSNVLFLLVFYLETLVSCPEDRLGCVHLEGHKGEAFTYLLKGYFPHLSEGEEVRLVCVAGAGTGAVKHWTEEGWDRHGAGQPVPRWGDVFVTGTQPSTRPPPHLIIRAEGH